MAATVLLASLAACTVAGPDPGVPGAGDAVAGRESARAQAERLLRMGASALERGEAAAAARLLERAVQLDPEETRGATLLGRAFLALGRDRDAADVFRSILDRRPEDVPAALGFARAMLALDRPEVAIEQLRPLARRSADPDVVNLLGVALTVAGRQEEAIGLLREARRRAPGDRRLAENLALALAFAGRHDEAVALLRPLADGVGSNARSRQNLALVYGLAGRIEAAERLMRVDLDDEAVANNVRFFRLLAAGSRAARLAALVPVYRPRASDLVESDWVELEVAGRGGAPGSAAQGAEPRPGEAAAAGVGRSGGPADAPVGPEGPAREGAKDRDGATAVPATDVAAATGGSGPAPVRPQATAEPPLPLAAVALEPGDLARGAAPVGEWVLRLGMFPDGRRAAAAWRELRRRFPQELSGLTRLSAAEPGPQPLLVGPLADGDEAERLCVLLREAGGPCYPLRL